MPNVTIESNLDDAIHTATELQNEIPTSADDAAQKIAQSWRTEAQRSLVKGGHVNTGTGLRSLKTTSLGTGKAGVVGADYLMFVQTGTPPHVPDVTNPRFDAAARSYGMSRFDLAQTIAVKGTRPHDWMGPTNDRIRKKAPRQLKIELNKAVKQSLK